MHIEQREISTIKPYERNAKLHDALQIQQLANSIKEFGFNQPLVVDEAGVIIVGHGRYQAALLLSLTTVPVITVNLTEQQAKAYRLADNKLNESGYKMDLVISELKLLEPAMIDLTGFKRDLILEKPEPNIELSSQGNSMAKPKCTVCGEHVACETCDDNNLLHS